MKDLAGRIMNKEFPNGLEATSSSLKPSISMT
jgi:hypothetical protein